MAFLDNSGDIILDAVLTDTGRMRMAKGEFRIVKFAFSDEEINYGLFNPDHADGSSSWDLEIMKTPILEAFTNNTSLMKTKLISINREDILYMPTFKLNSNLPDSKQHALGATYVILADTNTEPTSSAGSLADGTLHGVAGSALNRNRHFIAVDQGLDTEGNPPRTSPMDADLIESGYLFRMDDRILKLTTFDGSTYSRQNSSFVDDDLIASYYISSTNSSIVPTQRRVSRLRNDDTKSVAEAEEVFNGPLGPRIRFAALTTESIQQSDALFDELGTTGTSTLSINSDSNDDLTAGTYKFIDTIINIVGISSGYSIDIPIRVVKKVV